MLYVNGRERDSSYCNAPERVLVQLEECRKETHISLSLSPSLSLCIHSVFAAISAQRVVTLCLTALLSCGQLTKSEAVRQTDVLS